MDYDVLIAGGGTSGAYAAFLLAGSGIRVVVAEKRIDAGSPPSGMCLIGENPAKKYLGKWLGKSLAIHREMDIEALSENFKLNLKENMGIMQFGREKLDRNILVSAGNEGADILIRSELTSFREENNEIHAVLKAEGKDKKISAKYLIVATGAHPMVNALHSDECRNAYFKGILSRGFFTSDMEDSLELKIDENSMILQSRNQRFWEEAIITKSDHFDFPKRDEGAIKPSAVINYEKKFHTCVPRMGQNVFPVGESAGLFGESTSFGIDMALESAKMAAGFIEKGITGDSEYEKYVSEINRIKERISSTPSRDKVLSGEICEIEKIVSFFRKR